MKTAIHLGVSITEYEKMTPYELVLFAEVYAEKQEIANEEKITLVWLAEYYHRLKKLPSLQKELKSFKSSESNSNVMTDEQMLNVVKALNIKFGGNVEVRSDG